MKISDFMKDRRYVSAEMEARIHANAKKEAEKYLNEDVSLTEETEKDD